MTELLMAPGHNERLRDRFANARERLGLTQEQLAAALGMSVSSVARKERGEQAVTERDVAALEGLIARRTGTVSRDGADPGGSSVSEPATAYGDTFPFRVLMGRPAI